MMSEDQKAKIKLFLLALFILLVLIPATSWFWLPPVDPPDWWP